MTISIITPSYNNGKTISWTIESILKQDFKDIEYIIIDGNSTDNTTDTIKEYEPMFNGRLKWISEPDNGLYEAMNKGIKMATGEIVGILNADDFYHRTDIISKIAREFKANDIDALYGDLIFVSSKNINKTVRYYSAKNFNISKFKFGFAPPHPTFFTYKKNFEKFGYYKTNYQISSDFELLVRFLYVNKLRAKYLPTVFLKMRTGGLSTNKKHQLFTNTKEQVKACRMNGIKTHTIFVLMKFAIKIPGFLFPKRYNSAEASIYNAKKQK